MSSVRSHPQQRDEGRGGGAEKKFGASSLENQSIKERAERLIMKRRGSCLRSLVEAREALSPIVFRGRSHPSGWLKFLLAPEGWR